ncbi:MAG TPA: hypothetical protein PLU52_06790 [Opitutaceae bacterium]|nr:hypothetical protein [Opitutaceae bacterium]HND61209.1 hypothetical protein [Opitutaceae bacterium]
MSMTLSWRRWMLKLTVVAAAVALFSNAAVAAPGDPRMLVVTTDLTKEGKVFPEATAEIPIYYVPVFLGYSDSGGEIAQHYQRKPPSDEDIQRLVVNALKERHYLLASHEHPPTITVAVEWGTITPFFVGNRVKNAAQIRARVLGDQARDTDWRTAGYTRELLSLSGRHFIMISAFAYQRTATKDHPDVLLWRTHSTTDLWGNYLEEVIKPMITVATPALGRFTKPSVDWHEPEGRVIVGEPVVKDPQPR